MASQLKKQKLVALDQPTHRGTTAVLEHAQIHFKVFPTEAICRDRQFFPRMPSLQIPGHIIRTAESYSLAIKLTGMVELPIAVSLFLPSSRLGVERVGVMGGIWNRLSARCYLLVLDRELF